MAIQMSNKNYPKAKIRVLLADDHAVLRSALGALLGKCPDLELAGEVGDGEEAVRVFKELSPDITLMDLSMPRKDGLTALTEILSWNADARVVILSSYGFEEDIHRALEIGARGYLPKTVGHRELFEAIRAVHRGETWIPEEISSRLRLRDPDEVFTARETEALELLAKGFSNRELGTAMGISERGAKYHVEKILQKLHAADRTEAVAEAYKRGLLKLQS